MPTCYGCLYVTLNLQTTYQHECERATTKTFRIWCDDEPEDDGGGESYGYSTLEQSVTAYADYCHARRDGWEWTWPVTFRVRELATGKLFEVEVERETVPEFRLYGRPKPITETTKEQRE